MLNVGLNLVFLIPGETGGMETAARETIPHLAAIDDLRLTLFVNREGAGTFGGIAEEVVVPVNATSRIQWVRGEQQFIPRLAAARGCEVVHSLGSTAPLRGAFKRVTTIHDLNYRMVPDSHFGLRGLGMRALVPAAARRSDRIIVDAESTRNDLRDLLKVNPRKVDVVPLGVTPHAGEPTAAAELRAALDLPDGPLVLCPGGQAPAQERPRRDRGARRSWSDPPALVVTGYSSPYEQRLRELADVRGVNLRMPRYLDTAGLDGLYAAGVLRRGPLALRGLRAAGARGDGARRAGGLLEPRVAAGGGWRRRACSFDPEDPADIRRGDRARCWPIREPLRLRAGRQRAAALHLGAHRELTAESYRRALGRGVARTVSSEDLEREPAALARNQSAVRSRSACPSACTRSIAAARSSGEADGATYPFSPSLTSSAAALSGPATTTLGVPLAAASITTIP